MDMREDYEDIEMGSRIHDLLPNPGESVLFIIVTRNSSGDEIANVNFRHDDIVHALQNTVDSCMNSAQIDSDMCWYTGLPNSVK